MNLKLGHLLLIISASVMSLPLSADPAADKMPLKRVIKTVENWVLKRDVESLEKNLAAWQGDALKVIPKSRDGQSMMMSVWYAERNCGVRDSQPSKKMDEVIAAWAVAYPQSTAWRTLECLRHCRRAYNEGTPEKRKAELTAAEKLLLDAEKIRGRTPDWYASAMMLSSTGAMLERKGMGFTRPQWLKNWLPLAEESIKTYTSHLVVPFHVATSLKTLGYEGGIEEWAKHVCRMIPQRGLEPYARIMWSMAPGYFQNDLFRKEGCGEWELVRQGFFDLFANGWETPWNLNNFLLLARQAEDRATVLHLLSRIGDNPDPETFAVMAKFEEIKAWSAHKAPDIKPLWKTEGRRPHSLDWSRDGALIYAGYWGSHVVSLDSKTGKSVSKLTVSDDPTKIYDICVSPDGKLVAAVTSDSETTINPGHCRVWEAASGKIIGDFTSGRGPLFVLDFSPDSRELLAGGGPLAGPSQVWHWGTSMKAYPLPWASDHTHSIFALAWSPDANSVIFNCANAKITVAEDAREIRRVSQVSTPGLSLASAFSYSPDAKKIAAVWRSDFWNKDNANGCVVVFDAVTKQPLENVMAPLTGGLFSVDYSPDGRFIAACGYDGFVYVLDSSTLAIKAWWNADQGILNKLRWSPAGDSIATAAEGGYVSVWPLKL